jgi:carboxypeptidase C (cathepsin A)
VPAGGPGCSSLTYSFAAAGTYFVEVTSSNAQTGDIFLRIQ